AAPLALLETVRGAVAEASWLCRSLSVAHGGWLTAASGTQKPPVQAVVAVLAQTAHLLRLDGGNVGGVRQIPADDVEGVATALGPGAGRVLLLASPTAFDPMQRALAREGWSVSRDPDGWEGAEESTAARASGRRLELVPPSAKDERRRGARRNAVLLLAGALVLLLATAGVHLWGAHRELGAIREKRAEIRSEVGPLLLARDSLNALNARVEALMELEESAPLWTRSLVELTALLPRDTYITAFYASGDTVELEAAGTGAGEAIQSLRASGLFEDLRLQGIVERELDDGETVEERFTVRGRIPPAREGDLP
ncbi:MAG: PilN domain-containing protein, partial [Longimicrobiales bacterium]